MRAKLVRDAGNKIHLQLGHFLCAAGIAHQGYYCGQNQQQDSQCQCDIAPPSLRHNGLKRTGVAADTQKPQSGG